MRGVGLGVAVAVVCAGLAGGAVAAAPAAASASFVNLHDGDVVSSPFVVKFAVTGLTVAPAGTMAPHTGHFHLLVDTKFDPAMTGAIPADAHHLHFGKGQMQTSVTLPPGKHVLQLVMGDGAHRLHQPPVYSAPITVTVR